MLRPGAAAVVVGSLAHRGAINVRATALLGTGNDLTLQNGGAGSGGINLLGGLSIPGRMLSLSSGGRVTQAGPIVAGRLLLHGTRAQSSFDLVNPAKAVSRFSAHFEVPKGPAVTDGDVNIRSVGDLEIGALSARGFDGSANVAQTLTASTAVIAGDLVAHAGADLILNQGIRTLGSDITPAPVRCRCRQALATPAIPLRWNCRACGIRRT